MTDDEIKARMELSHKLHLVARQIDALAAEILEPVRKARVWTWLDRPTLTEDEVFTGVVDPKTWQPEQTCLTG